MKQTNSSGKGKKQPDSGNESAVPLNEDNDVAEYHKPKTLELLYEISEALSNVKNDFKDALNHVTKQIATVIGDLCVVRLISDDKKRLDEVAFFHPNKMILRYVSDLYRDETYYLKDGLAGEVFKTGKGRLIAEISPSEEAPPYKKEYARFANNFGISSLVVVPLKAQTEVIGVISLIRNNSGNPYTETDQKILQVIADNIALVISNSNQYEEKLKETEAKKIAEDALKV
ncbi:MAG: GAF domain-containing protein [Ignavibacteria bacterium]